MEANAGLVVGSHNRNELVVIRNESGGPRPLKHVNGHICQICGDDVGITSRGDLFIACNECAFPICRPCYEYERKDGNQTCPHCKTSYNVRELVVKPTPTCQDAPLKLPYAMHPHQHIPLENPDNGEEEAKTDPYFEGSFWNYFSIGMDAQVACGFHHLHDEAPWLVSGRISNQMVYGGYRCVQGWFCAPCATALVLRGLRQIMKVYIKRSHDFDAQWEELELPAKAIVILNLQSYAGGRNPWGRPSSGRQEKTGYVEAKCDDGVREIVDLWVEWHTALCYLTVTQMFVSVRPLKPFKSRFGEMARGLSHLYQGTRRKE